MRDVPSPQPARFVDRMARIAFTFIVMNCSAIVGAVSALLRRRVWR